MPLVPERKLSYGENLEKLRKLQKHKESLGSKQFSKVEPVRLSKAAQTGYVKHRKRTRLTDKTIISEDIARLRHIRSIVQE